MPFLTLGTCVGLCLSGLGGASATAEKANPASVTGLEETTGATLEELNQAPADWIGRRVRFVFQFHSAPEAWNPYLSRFGKRDYLAARCWSDAQVLWKADEYDAPAGMLFARRGSAAAEALAAAPVYGRYEAVGLVRQVFLGRAWIDVERVERLPEEVGEGAILHASRALRSMETCAWKLALEDLARAEASNLPPHARAELAALREECEAALAPRRSSARR